MAADRNVDDAIERGCISVFGAAEARAVRNGFAEAFKLLVENSRSLCAESLLDVLRYGVRVFDKRRSVDDLPHTRGASTASRDEMQRGAPALRRAILGRPIPGLP